jgi:hypothetical protein
MVQNVNTKMESDFVGWHSWKKEHMKPTGYLF